MYDGPDVPSADLPEDITGPEPQTVPLDVSTLHKVPGYETVGYYADGKYIWHGYGLLEALRVDDWGIAYRRNCILHAIYCLQFP